MSSVHLLTGEIKSGKTTRLQKWAVNNNTDGILAPVIDGKRHLTRIKSGETKLLEYVGEDNAIELTKIGNYNFLASVFEWGRNEMYDAYLKRPEWLIIDEIGPLELRGEGMEPVVSKILNENISTGINVVLVVRKSLLETVIEHYGLRAKGFEYFNVGNNTG
jgi:nucleoside-triphosphatase THEP1